MSILLDIGESLRDLLLRRVNELSDENSIVLDAVRMAENLYPQYIKQIGDYISANR